jgi:hypothetical protein
VSPVDVDAIRPAGALGRYRPVLLRDGVAVAKVRIDAAGLRRLVAGRR